METDVELERARDDVLRKIGRNIILFQQMEGLIKLILVTTTETKSGNPPKTNLQNRAAKIKKQTMRTLVDQFFDETHVELGTPEKKIDHENEFFKLSIKIQGDSEFLKSRKALLDSIVNQRNELVHHFMERFDPTSIVSCNENSHFLDLQRESLLPELELLKTLLTQISDFFAHQNSEEGRNERLKYGIVGFLWDVASHFAGRDGWTSMTTAEQLVKQYANDDMNKLKKSYRHKTLKQFMESSELFDIKEEKTGKGGVRVLYRLKPELPVGENQIQLAIARE